VLGQRLVPRVIEHEALSVAQSFLEGGTRSPRTISVVGKHGTGRSVLAMQLAETLWRQGHQHIYVADDVFRFSQTDLRDVLPADARSLLFIDDADVQDAVRPVYNALGAIEVCALGTFSKSRTADRFRALSRTPADLILLPDRPSSAEMDALKVLVPPGYVSKARQRIINRCNLRSVVRLFAGEPPPEALARRLMDLRYEDRSLGRAVTMLVQCGMHDILLPSSLLIRAIGEDLLPEELAPWLQSRPAFEVDGESSVVWVEDRHVLSLANRVWKDNHVLDENSYDDEVLQTLRLLVDAVDSGRRGDRMVLRQILRRAPRKLARSMAEQATPVIRDCLGREQDRGSLLAWLGSIPLDVSSRDDLRAAVQSKVSETDVDVGALLSFVTDEATRSAVTDVAYARDIAGLASIERWADLLELFEGPRLDLLGSGALFATLELLRHHDDCWQILGIKNSTQILATHVTKEGAPAQRRWLRDALLDGTHLDVAHVQFLTELTKRCVMQVRHQVALDPRWDPPRSDHNVVKALSEEYDRLWLSKEGDRTGDVSARVEHLLRSQQGSIGRADHLWGQYLDFVEYYNRSQLSMSVAGALSFVLEKWPAGYGNVRMALSRLLDVSQRSRMLTRDQLGAILEMLASCGFGGASHEDVLFRFFGAASLCEHPPVAVAAVAALRSMLDLAFQARIEAFDAAWPALVEAVGATFEGGLLSVRGADLEELPRRVIATSSVVSNLMRYPADTRRQDLEAMIVRFGNIPGNQIRLFVACLRLGELDLARTLLPKSWFNDANWSLLAARLLAAEGDLLTARQLVRRPVTLRGHAHPLQVSMAQFDLARWTRGFERESWLLLAALTRPGELQPKPSAPPAAEVAI
jgi:hypothetical protein